MITRRHAVLSTLALCASTAFSTARKAVAVSSDLAQPDDPYLWLEEIDSTRSREWLEAHNAETLAALKDTGFERDRKVVLDLLDAPDRIPGIVMIGGAAYNFWKDAANPRGVWRRTTLASYRTGAPDWESVIDVDALAKADGVDWQWGSVRALPPDYQRCLVWLSRGGADAAVMREFDLVTKRFVDDGFVLPEAKGTAIWIDRDTLLVATALGGERFQTASGYARTVRRWSRGTPFADAPIVFEGARSDMRALMSVSHHPGRRLVSFSRQTDFVNFESWIEDPSGRRHKLDVPSDAQFAFDSDRLLVNLRSAWTLGGRTYPAGTLLVAGFDAFMAGQRDFTVLFEPTQTAFLTAFVEAGGTIAMQILDNVRSRIVLARSTGNQWVTETLSGFPDMATLSIGALCRDGGTYYDKDHGDLFVLRSETPIDPLSISLVRFGKRPQPLARAKPRFDATGLTITQHFATSVDGKPIPYFQIAHANLPLDGSSPTLLYGYGGFQTVKLPNHSPVIGALWLERGGVYVIANIRGGGEFGSAWHKAGVRSGKKLSHDDFAAVAKDLIARGVTRPEKLACSGASNGGLLTGNMLTRYPDLFGAIVCDVPLLDMKRYTKLLVGKSWIAEYGDPEKPEDRTYLAQMSAYHCVEALRKYPPMLLTTSTRDDRVHPGHARKMAARLRAHGHPAFFFEYDKGGHASNAENAHNAFKTTLFYAFLRKTIASEAGRT